MKVLYATDGSPASAAAARLLAALANRADLEISALGVLEDEPLLAPDSEAVRDLRAAARARVNDVAGRAAGLLEEAGVAARPEVAEGWAGRAIVHRARSGGYDLVVVGAGRSSRLGNLLLGSVSTCVLHNSPAPVLVVHSAPAGTGSLRVMVTTDGSPGARSAAGTFAALADPARCRVTVMAVAKIPYMSVGGYPYPAIDPRVAAELLARARRGAEELAEVLRAGGFEAEPLAAAGAAHHVILDEADKGAYDLVVAGSRGHGPVLRTLMGSVSDALARHSRAALVGREPEGTG